jgi:hypothetical protein
MLYQPFHAFRHKSISTTTIKSCHLVGLSEFKMAWALVLLYYVLVTASVDPLRNPNPPCPGPTPNPAAAQNAATTS